MFSRRIAPAALICWAVSTGVASYASSGGSITGTIRDAAARVVQNAAITIRETDTNATFIGHTNRNGFYNFPVLPVGHYALEVQSPGFADYQRLAIDLNTDDALSINVSLAIASQQARVVVQESPAQLDADDTELGDVISGRQMEAVPLNGRAFTDLLSLQAGVAPVTTITNQTVQDVGASTLSPSGDLNPGTISINGQREFANAFLVNGSDTEEDVNAGTTIIPNLDSISEFRILTANFDAQYGGYSGGQIKVITKSGSNSFHGDVFDFLRNTNLDARNYFSPTRGDFHQNQFGGTFGGPVLRNRSFFFADYQGTRQTMGVDTGDIPVPSLADRGGNLGDSASQLTGTVTGSYFANLLSQKLGHTVLPGEAYYAPGCTTAAQCVLPNAVIPGSAFSAPAQALLQYIPQPNVNASTFATSSADQSLQDDKGGLRGDANTRAGTISLYYFHDDYNLDNPYPVAQSGANVPGFNALYDGTAQLASIGLTTLGARAVNETHVSFMRTTNDLGQPVGGLGVPLQSQGFISAQGQTSIVPLAPDRVGVENIVFNNFSIGSAANELKQVNNTYEASEDYSRIVGQHTLRIGAAFHHDEVNVNPIAQFNGNFQFGGTETGLDFADFLLGVPTAYNQSQLDPFYGRNNYAGAYAQDSWHALPELMLNYGVRWDRISPWSEKFNEISTFRAGAQSQVFPGAPPGILYPGDPGVPDSLAPAGDEFSPRLGISYTPRFSDDGDGNPFLGKSGATTFRAGFGSYYTSYEALTLGVLAANAPYGITYTSPAPPLFNDPFTTASTGQDLGQPFPIALAPHGASRSHPNVNIDWGQFTPISGIPGFASTNRVPYIEEYMASIERQVTPNLLFSITYTGNSGHRLLVLQEANPGNPALCLSLSQQSEVATGTLTCGPTLESSVFTTASGTTVNGTRGPLGPNFGSNASQLTEGPSSYNALELTARYDSHRLDLIAAYTYSKSLDESSNVGEEVNPENPALSYALSSFDLRHNFVASYDYELPFDQLLHRADRLTKDWRISGITRFSTGFPVTLVNDSDNSLLGTLNNGINNFYVDMPQRTSVPLGLNKNPRTPGNQYFDPGALVLQPLGTPGDVKRRFFPGPGQNNTDLALSKHIELHEARSLELRLEAFNAFNHTQFFGPGSVNGVLGSSNFGSIVSSASPRICQAAARLTF